MEQRFLTVADIRKALRSDRASEDLRKALKQYTGDAQILVVHKGETHSPVCVTDHGQEFWTSYVQRIAI